tara:strand:+ start:367 stop:543 length:177 start_codon:yes stop_codon:yes gene_type:complete
MEVLVNLHIVGTNLIEALVATKQTFDGVDHSNRIGGPGGKANGIVSELRLMIFAKVKL